MSHINTKVSKEAVTVFQHKCNGMCTLKKVIIFVWKCKVNYNYVLFHRLVLLSMLVTLWTVV
jgi:hypothetical protein